jgi:hypothetical protein
MLRLAKTIVAEPIKATIKRYLSVLELLISFLIDSSSSLSGTESKCGVKLFPRQSKPKFLARPFLRSSERSRPYPSNHTVQTRLNLFPE